MQFSAAAAAARLVADQLLYLTVHTSFPIAKGAWARAKGKAKVSRRCRAFARFALYGHAEVLCSVLVYSRAPVDFADHAVVGTESSRKI